MIHANNLFEQAQLAEAAYADLSKVKSSGEKEKDQYTDALKKNDFSATQAAEFADRYELIDHLANTDSGFSSTLFKDKNGVHTLAFRGTEPGDAWNDFLKADVSDIFIGGIAIHQAVDMFNYYQSLTTEAGCTYTAKELQ
jgi:hypothetical protein